MSMRDAWVRGTAAALIAFPATLALAGTAEPPDARALLTQYRCYVCHADRETLTGPAFADVAAQLRGKQNAVPKVAQQIRGGVNRGGPWHMPPHPEVSKSEATVMARYILSLAPSRP